MKICWQCSETTQKLADSLLKNEISITTTDTIPGFLANTTKQGFKNLNKIKKGRLQNKPYIILVAGVARLRHFLGSWPLPDEINSILLKCWPGPLTVIFKAKPGLPFFLKSENDTVAIRCPRHIELLNLLHNFDGLFSTSVNVGGEPPALSFKGINPEFVQQVKFLVGDDERVPCGINKASTIIDVSNFELDRRISFVREGAILISDLEKICGLKLR